MLKANLRELYRSRDLMWAWISRTIRGRYQQSILGWLWAIVQPLASVAIFTIVFTRFVPVDTEQIPYVIFAFVAMVPWTLFSTSLTDMTTAIVQNMALVSKIYFPREVLPIATMLARLLDFGVAWMMLIVLMIFFRIPIYLGGWLLVPVIFLLQLLLILGLGLICAAANVFTRDIEPLVKLGVQLWFYASPVIYPVTTVPEPLLPYYFLNPMAGILQAYRDLLILGNPLGTYIIPAAVISLLVFVAGYWYFKRVDPLFADIV